MINGKGIQGLMNHMEREGFCYGGEVPKILTADPLNVSVDWDRLANMPFKALLEARRKLFSQNKEVRDIILRGQPQELVDLWMSDIDSGDPVITLVRPDYVITDKGEVVAAEFDLLPGGCGITVGMEDFAIDNKTRTLAVYEEFLRRVGVDENSVVVLAVPDQHDPYLHERRYLGKRLREQCGLPVYGRGLDEIDWENLTIIDENGFPRRITHMDRLYFWYETEFMDPANRKKLLDLESFGIREFPSLKREYLHAKVWEAFFWDPKLEDFWKDELGSEVFESFQQITPETWFLSDVRERILSMKKGERKGFLLKEGAPEQSSSWGSRSVTFLEKVSTKKVREIVETLSSLSCKSLEALEKFSEKSREEIVEESLDLKMSEGLKIRGGIHVSPIIQRVVESKKFRIDTNHGDFQGRIRFTPFTLTDGNGYNGFTPGLSTLRNSRLVHGSSDSVMVTNV